MSSTALLRLLGDLATPAVEDLLKSNEESLDWSLKIQRQALRKKKSIIRPGPPPKTLHVGGEQQVYEVWITTKDGRHILIGGPAAKNGTLSAHFRAAQGHWTPERQKLHEKIVDDMLAGKNPPEGRQPVATILGGGTASGKTTSSKAILGEDPNVLRVDPDEIKLKIPEYKGLKESDPLAAAKRVHDESSFVTGEVMKNAIARKLDLTYDATTSGNGGPEMAKQLIKQGYKVNVMFVNIPISMAKERSEYREKNSTEEMNKGRHVDPDIIEQSHYGSAAKFQVIKDIPGIHDVSLYDTKTRTPAIVYHKSSDGKEVIHDSKLWDEYKQKGQRLHEALAGQYARTVSRQGGGKSSFQGSEPTEEKAAQRFRQKRLKVRAYTPSPTTASIGQLPIPYGNTAMGDATAPRRGRRRKSTAFQNQMGQRYWIGIGGGIRSQYGDYNQARPRLHIVLENRARKFHSVQFDLEPLDAEEVLKFPVERFADKGREMHPHVTVLFGLHQNVTPDEVEKIVHGFGPISAIVSSVETFPAGEHGVPLILKLESPRLVELHDAIAKLPHTDTHAEYVPHVNIGYLNPEDEAPINSEEYLVGRVFVLKKLVFSGTDKSMVTLAEDRC